MSRKLAKKHRRIAPIPVHDFQRRKRERLSLLYQRQNGQCYWCGKQMRAPGSLRGNQAPPDDYCTLEHLSPAPKNRLTKAYFRKTVGACHKCNQHRGHRRGEELALAQALGDWVASHA